MAFQEYKHGIKTFTTTPIGDAGQAINSNFIAIADLFDTVDIDITISDVGGLQAALDAKANISGLIGETLSLINNNTEYLGISLNELGNTSIDVASGQLQLNGVDIVAGLGDGTGGGMLNMEAGSIDVRTLDAKFVNMLGADLAPLSELPRLTISGGGKIVFQSTFPPPDSLPPSWPTSFEATVLNPRAGESPINQAPTPQVFSMEWDNDLSTYTTATQTIYYTVDSLDDHYIITDVSVTVVDDYTISIICGANVYGPNDFNYYITDASVTYTFANDEFTTVEVGWVTSLGNYMKNYSEGPSGDILMGNGSIENANIMANTLTLKPSVSPPTNWDSPGSLGEITWDASRFYVCTATNSWRHIPISGNPILANDFKSVFFGGPGSGDNVKLIIAGDEEQSTPLQSWRDFEGTPIANMYNEGILECYGVSCVSINSTYGGGGTNTLDIETGSGNIYLNTTGYVVTSAPTVEIADETLLEGMFSVSIDQIGNTLTFKVKYNDEYGTVKTGTIALS